MPRTRTFTAAQLAEWGLPHQDELVRHREQIDTRRWVSVHQILAALSTTRDA